MKMLEDAWAQTKDWKVEKPGFDKNEMVFRLVPVLGNIYPLESDAEIGNSLTQTQDPYAKIGVYAGTRLYSDCGKLKTGAVFFGFNSTTGDIERYFAKNLEFFKKDQPALYVHDCDLETSEEERAEAMEMLRRANLLPDDVRMQFERKDIAITLNNAIRTHKFQGVSQRRGDVSRCDLGMEVA